MLKVRRTTATEMCEQLEELERAGDYAGLRALIAELWPSRDSLTEIERAELLLRAGLLAGRTGESPEPGLPHETAKDMLTESMRIFERHGKRMKAAEAALGLGVSCKQDGTFDDALVWLRRAEELTPADEKLLRCKTRLMCAIVEEDAGRLQEALQIHEEIARLFLPKLEDDGLAGKCHNERAIVLRRLWQATDKADYADAALIEYAAAGWHFERGGDLRCRAIIENNTAYLKLALGRPLDALENVQAALRVVERSKDRLLIASYEETHAQVLLALRRHRAAIAAARRSVRLLQIGGERALLVESFVTLGVCYARGGDKEGAFESFMAAIEVAEFIEFGDGLVKASIALLEELPDLPASQRWEVHHKYLKHMAGSQDGSLIRRHSDCLAKTCEMLAVAGATNASELRPVWDGFSLDETLDALERFCIVLAFEEAGGCQTRAAKLLGISDSNLYNKLRGKYAELKELHTKGHYRRKGECVAPSVPPFTVVDDESLSDYGFTEGTILFYRPVETPAVGRIVVVESGGKEYVGVWSERTDGATLEPAASGQDFENWEFIKGEYSILGEVYAYVLTDAADRKPMRV